MGSRHLWPEIDPSFSLEVARQQRQGVARYSQEISEDPQAAFERKIRTVIQWNKDREGKSFIASFMKELGRSAVEVTGGDYRLVSYLLTVKSIKFSVFVLESM